MDRSGAARATRDLVALLIGGLLVGAIALLNALPPIRPATAGVPWLANAAAGALVAVAIPSILAALVVGLRTGSAASILLAGSGAALAGGGMALLAGAPSMAVPLLAGAAMLGASALVSRVRPRARVGRRRAIALAVALMAMGEAAAVLELVGPVASAVDPARAAALWAVMAIGGASAIAFVGRGSVASAILVGIGALGTLADRGGSLESIVGLGALVAAMLFATAASMDELTSADPVADDRLPELVARLAVAVLRFDGNLQLRDWNQSAAGLLSLDAGSRGMRLEELLGIRLGDLPDEDDAATVHGIGGLEVAIHRSGSGVTAVISDPGIPPEAERLGHELRTTIEELLRARRTIDLQRGELERSATIDPLTGVESRGAILERLRIDVAQARRYRHPLAVALLDVDHFGAINHDHGVGGGDAVLREVALRIRLRVREADALGRSGSDGFLAVLPHTDEAGAATFADALRHRLRLRPIAVGEAQVAVTVSVGVATMRPGEDLDLDGLLTRVEEALESARSAGGDRIALDRLHGLARLEDRRDDEPPPAPTADTAEG